MKKQNLILDFTSLLDVILILLFIVLANMNQSSLSAVEQAESSAQEAQSQVEILTQENQVYQDSLERIQIEATENVDIYASVIDEMTKVNLICQTAINPETADPEVEIDIYVDMGSTGQKTLVACYVIAHESDLTATQRQILSANQTVELTQVLTGVLDDQESAFIWFMVQYDYEDALFTYSDLEILKSAMDNVELTLSVPCYLEKIYVG